MQEIEKSSSEHKLTIEQLLQLKRFEKPDADSWAGFERELQQKQLKALVRPSFWTRVRSAAVFAPTQLAPVAAAVALCAAGLVAISLFPGDDRSAEMTLAMAPEGAASVVVEKPAVVVPQTDFVVDTIVPAQADTAAASFQTHYVVNAFTIGRLGSGGGAFEF